MIINETAQVYYKVAVTTPSAPADELMGQRDAPELPAVILQRKNLEIAQLKQQLLKVATQVWQSEQLINRLCELLQHFHSFRELPHPSNDINNILRELKNSSQKQANDYNLVVDQEFIRRIQTNFPALSSNDLRICSLLRLNLSTKEIALKLGISAESANKARYRIRKKLGLSRNRDLVQHIIEF